MTQEGLIVNATTSFVGVVNCEVLIDRLEAKREYLAPWCCALMDEESPCYARIYSIIYALFERCVREPGETISRSSSAKFDAVLGCSDPFGAVIEVASTTGHLWIRYELSDEPLNHLEISVYDNTKRDE